MLIVIAKLRNKILMILRFLLVGAILLMLLSQLGHFVLEASLYYENWMAPQSYGDPLKVFNEQQDSTIKQNHVY